MSDDEIETKTRGTKRTRSSSGTLSSANEDDVEMRLASQESQEYLNPIVYIEYDPNKYDDNASEFSSLELSAKNSKSFELENSESLVSLKSQASKLRITRSMSRSLSSCQSPNKSIPEKATSRKTASDKVKAVLKKAISSKASSLMDNIPSAKEKKTSDHRKWSNSQRSQLLDAVLEEIGALNWEAVAEKVDGKNSRSCRNQWKKKLIGDLRNSFISDK